MPAKITILTAPARSGKTTRLLTRVRRQITSDRLEGQTSGIVWIAPNARSAEAIRDQLLLSPYSNFANSQQENVTVRASLGVSVVTFDQFAGRIVEASDEEVRPLSRLMQRRLLRELIDEKLAANEITYHAQIAESDGFLELVAEQIQELKYREIWPEKFSEALGVPLKKLDAGTGVKPTKSHGKTKTESDRSKLPPSQQKNYEIALLYQNYQDILNAHRLYDTEGRFWVARALLQEGHRHPFSQTRLLVVDGFSDFTRTQLEILSLLCPWLKHVFISLPSEYKTQNAPLPPRVDLFAKAIDSLTELKRILPTAKIVPMPAAESSWPVMNYVERNLFRPPQQVEPFKPAVISSCHKNDVRHSESGGQSSPPSNIDIFIGPSDKGELEIVAAEIKRLTVEQHVSPGDIVVIARAISEQSALFREVFTQFGIPHALETRKPVSASVLYRGLIALLHLDQEDWPFRNMLSLVTSRAYDWYSVEASKPENQEKASAVCENDEYISSHAANRAFRIHAERLIRKFQIDKGKTPLLKRLMGRANLPDEELSPSQLKRRKESQRVLFVLERLARWLDQLPKTATPKEWTAALALLARKTGLLQNKQLSVSNTSDTSSSTGNLKVARQNTEAWHRLAAAIHSTERLHRWRSQEPPQLSRSEIIKLLQDAAHGESLDAENDGTGCVQILSAPSVRAIRIPYLFVVGLTEKSFPSPLSESRLFADAEYSALQKAGVSLTTRAERNSEEMLLFYELLTRVEQKLTLSYAGLDEKATALPPSPYLHELLELLGEEATVHDLRECGPVISQAKPASPQDYRLQAINDCLTQTNTKEPKDSQTTDRISNLLAHAREESVTTNPLRDTTSKCLEAGLKLAVSRSTGDTFGPGEGIFTSEQAMLELRKDFGLEHLFSPTQLEEYAKCPFQFFMHRVLQCEPLDNLVLETDFMYRGKLMHDSLAAFHQSLAELSRELPITEKCDAEDFVKRLLEKVEHFLEASQRFGVDGGLQELDKRQVSAWANLYYDQHTDYDAAATELDRPLLPAHFEVRFGPKGKKEDVEEDARSIDAPFELLLNNGAVKITGRVDRIDLGQAGGRTVFNIVDYKTGKSKPVTDEAIASGTMLQLPLYAMAVQNLLLKDLNALPWQADYWWLRDVGFGKKLGRTKDAPKAFQLHTIEEGAIIPTDRWNKLQADVVERVEEIVSGIQHGAFPMVNADEQCTSYCDFKTVCRIGQVRAIGKTWPPKEEPKE